MTESVLMYGEIVGDGDCEMMNAVEDATPEYFLD